MKERELPEGWEWKRLGDLIELKYGDGLKGDKREASGKIPVYGSNGIVGYHNKPLTTKSCLIIGRKGSIGEVHLSDGPCWPIDTTYFVEPTPQVDLKFLYYLLKTLRLNSLDRSTAIPGLNRNDVYSKIIPLPPLPIQRQIVAVLENVEVVKQYRQEADALTGALLQSVFREIFGDPVTNERGYPIKTLSELCSHITDGKHGDCTNLENSGYFFISAKDIINGKIDYTNSRQITREDYLEVNKRVNFEIGDIIITNSGSIGKIAIAEDIEKTPRTTFQKSVAIIKPNKQLVNLKYLATILDLNKQELMKQSSGSSQKNLLLRDINEFKIPFPPLALQQQFARVVESVERIREQQVASGRQIEGLCEGLMQRAFKGELVA